MAIIFAHKQERDHVRSCFLSVLCLCLISGPLSAGGFSADYARVNGHDRSAKVKPVEKVTLCYRKRGYLFSGFGNEYAHLLFAVVPDLELTGAVGKDGDNYKPDVEKIVNVMKDARLLRPEIEVDDIDSLIEGIERYQRSQGSSKPDGRIDRNGRTLRIPVKLDSHSGANWTAVPA